ncbi:hypothetical protein LCGC14_2620260 [marine sediment metagenome]|uniref:Uncharacterized protein n=1 Tax=marine sediment metagenome TaxID=412755 RepID=A0A0F9CVU7_9ZZZZ
MSRDLTDHVRERDEAGGPKVRIEAGGTGISPDDLRGWGDLRGCIAWSILCFATTDCRDKEAQLELLEHTTDEIISLCRGNP